VQRYALAAKCSKFKFFMESGGLIPESSATLRCVDKQDPKYVVNMSVPGAPVGSGWGGMFIGTHGRRTRRFGVVTCLMLKK
jgi:hypothetical protein